MLIRQPHFALDDPFLVERLHRIISDYGIHTVVETGTNEGKSTLGFSAMVRLVVGVDNDPECLMSAGGLLVGSGRENWRLEVGSSPGVLRRVIPEGSGLGNILFFLDAHWEGYWPLLDEIEAIGDLYAGRGVVVIHDMRVPGRDFGYDRYGGQPLEYDYVAAALTRWSRGHVVEYNTEAVGSRVGVGFVFP